jgi:hypothetical protein
VDGLEARVGELEATQFSTTTKLRGQATFVVGGNSFSGTQYGNPVNQLVAPGNATPFASSLVTPNGQPLNPNQAGAVLGVPNQQSNRRTLGATSFNYDVRLNLDTSFTGKDLLRTTLRAGNFFGNGVNPSAYGTGLTFLEVPTNAPTADNVVEVNRLFYNFPVGENFSVTAGARVRMDDAGMLGMWPSVYPADTVLDFFTYAGSPQAYNTSFGLGAGAGIVYNDVLGAKGWTLSTNYVSANGNQGNPNTGGIMTEGSQSTSVTQLGYTGGKFPVIGGSAWGLAAAYTYSQNMAPSVSTLLTQFFNTGTSNNVGISGYWVPENTGWIPSVSTGWGHGAYQQAGLWNNTSWARTNSWYLGLQWPDTFVKGNDLGMAVGQAPFMTTNGGGNSTDGYAVTNGVNGNLDSNYMWEWWYKFQVTDNITVTPALYYIQNYDGQIGKINISNGQYNASSNVFGGLLKTTFKF